MLFSFRRVIAIFILLISFSFITIKSFSNSNDRVDSLRVINLCDSAISNLPNYDICFDFVAKAHKLADKIACDYCLAQADYTKGVIYYESSAYDSALYYFDNSLITFLKSNNTQLIIDNYEYMSYSYMGLYNFDESIKYARLGLATADTLVNKINSANMYLLIGSCYNEMGLYEKSTSSLIEALTLFEVESDSSGISSAFINLGMIFSNDSNFVDAFNYTSRALEICEDQNDMYGVSACLNNIGDIYSSQKKFQLALEYFNRSLEIDKELDDIEGIAIGLNNIGDTYRDLHDTILAKSYFLKSLEVGRANNYPIVSVVLANLSELHLANGNLTLALDNALESLKLAESVRSNEQIINCYNLLNNIYAASGDYKNAYYYFEKYHNIRDSVFSLEKSRQIYEITSRYNDEKQRLEIRNLQKKYTSESHIRTTLILVIFAISFLIISMIIFNIINRRARRLVRKQKVYYEKLLDRSEDFIFVVGSDGSTKYISPSYERRIGRDISNRIGKSAFEFIHHDDIGLVKQEFNKLILDRKSRNIDFRMKNAFGEWISVYAHGQNLLDDPLINGVVVNFWDITQRKKNEELIRKSELRFRQLFNAFPDIYFQSDAKGIITDVSPSVFKITGYTREEVLGVSFREYHHFINDWKKIAARFENNNSVNDHDIKFKTKDGRIIYCSFTAEIVFDNDSIPIGITGVIRDISFRVKGERKLRKSQNELRVANSAKEKLFSIIAHDLIGPIGTNKSIVDLIVGQVDELTHEEIITLITSLKPSLDSTYSLIENLLSWARIQQHSLKPNFEVIQLNFIINMVAELLHGQAQRKSIQLVVTAEEQISIYADKNQIDIIIRNLVSNAIKFSNRESLINIGISKSSDMAEISISDKGIGMSQVQIKNILSGKYSDKQHRGTDNEKGTGFGLVIVNEFTKNNNGHLSIVSNQGGGTTFKVFLPLST